MMKAKIVSDLEQKYFNSFTIFAKNFLKENSFNGNTIICKWLCSVFESKLSTGKVEQLDKQITDEVKAEIDKGNLFYFETFRNSDFINENTKAHKSPQPLYDVVNSIYNKLLFNSNAEHENLIIYTELKHCLEEVLGEMIAKAKNLQQYEVWVRIADELRNEHNLFRSWFDAIPISSITKEKRKFSIIPSGTKLPDLANLRGYSKDNEQAVSSYLSHIDAIKVKPVVEYLYEASRSSDLLTFKKGIYLQQKLLKRAGLKEWLLFTDSLVYPNLQDHSFLLIDELDDYISTIQNLSNLDLVTTPKEHLLIITLENYFDFLNRTVGDLQGMASRKEDVHNDAEVNEVLKVAEKELEEWMEKFIPDSFEKILASLFSEMALRKNLFFITFFDWINSHTALHYTHPSTNFKIKILDALNEVFIKRLLQNEEDVQYLINNLQPHEINYEALKKLVTVLAEKKPSAPYRDKLFDLYNEFINSDRFSWYADENVDFATAINNTYYFSQVLNSFEHAIQKWDSLFHLYKVNYEGWVKSPSDYKNYQREAFLFCTGIGMAYNLYNNNNQTDGRERIFAMLNLLLKQLRNSGDMISIDYLTPIKFASITIGEFDKGNSETYLYMIAEKCDKLKYVLVALNDLFDYHKTFIPSERLRHIIKKRIKDEFWIIENKKSEAVLRNQLDYYEKLKDKILDLCQ